MDTGKVGEGSHGKDRVAFTSGEGHLSEYDGGGEACGERGQDAERASMTPVKEMAFP